MGLYLGAETSHALYNFSEHSYRIKLRGREKERECVCVRERERCTDIKSKYLEMYEKISLMSAATFKFS